MKPALMLAGMYVKFSVSGTAAAGIDYVALVSPAYIGQSGYGVIQIKTLRDPRAASSRQAYSVVITLEDAAGYSVGNLAQPQCGLSLEPWGRKRSKAHNNGTRETKGCRGAGECAPARSFKPQPTHFSICAK